MLRNMAIELSRTGNGAILYDSARTGKPSDDIFESEHWSAQGRIVARATGRGAVIFVRAESGAGEKNWVVRHYRRGGMIARVIADRYLWLGAERSRPFREWRLLHALQSRGLPVPPPVAARYVRDGLTYRADLITEALPATRTLADAVTQARLDQSIWQQIGATIARFHACGAHHPDLNVHNILLAAGGGIYLIDFDRGRMRARGAWEDDVLGRLRRSLLKIQSQRAGVMFHESDWRDLLSGYETERAKGSSPV